MTSSGGRKPESPGGQVLTVWALSALPQSLRVAGHGPDGRTGAAVLALTGLVLAVVLLVDGVPRTSRAVAAVAVAAVGASASTGLVGRMPWTLTVLAALVVAAAVVLPSPVAVLLAVLPAAVWVGTGASLPTLALLVVAAVAAGLSSRTGVLDRADATVVRAAAWSRRVLGVPVRAAVGWWRDPSTRPARWSGAVGALVALPVMWRLTLSESVVVRGTNDYEAHVRRAVAITLSPFFVSVPHPAWHLAFRGLDPLVGARVAVVLLGCLAAGAAVAVFVTVGRSVWDDLPALSPRLAALYGLSLLLLDDVGQLVPRGPHWWNRLDVVGLRARGSSYFPMHQWGSPTMTLSLPLVVLMVATLMFSLRKDHDRARRHRVALGVLTVVATFTLPAATLALVPAVVLYLLAARRWDRRTLSVVVPYFVVPGALACLAQTTFLASGVSEFERTGWRWNPFWIARYVGLDRPAFWLLLLVVPAAWWLVGRRYTSDPWVVVSGLALAVALVPALFLQQTSPDKVLDGDLAMPAWFAGVLLVMASVRWIGIGLQDAWEDRRTSPLRPAAVAAGLLVLLMLCSGALDLLSAWGVVPEF